jgi:hypothetical protein
MKFLIVTATSLGTLKAAAAADLPHPQPHFLSGPLFLAGLFLRHRDLFVASVCPAARIYGAIALKGALS